MKSSFWTPYISDHTIHAICWTLIHSLWIGLVIALLAGLVITATRKSDAAFRYNLLCGILILFTVSVCATFCIEIWTPVIEQGVFHATQAIHAPGGLNIIVPATTPHISLVSRIVMLLNEYSNIIFMVWLLFFVLKSMKMAGGLLYIQRIRNYRVHEVPEQFKHKIELFAGQIGIRQAVRLVQSELVKVPVAVGWLKPMILLPMGILLRLSPEQLESILWHELAHIRRRDYLVNILQGIVETVFFFNPGLLWLSSLIRAEREACCDDIVLSRMNRKVNYLEALLTFGYEDNSKVSLAMSIGSGNQLRDRLKRMVNQENKRLSMAEKIVLAAGLVLLSAFTTISKDSPIIKNLVVKITSKAGKVITKNMAVSMRRLPEGRRVNDSTPGAREKRTIFLTDTSIRFTSVLFKLTDSDLTNNDISAMDATGKKYHFKVAGNKLVSMEIDGEKVKDSDLANYEYMIRQIDDAVMEKRMIRNQEGAYARMRTDRFKAGNRFDKQRYVDSIRTADLKKMNEIIAGLVAQKIVNNASDVKWFALTNTEFMVNGQKLSDEMQQRYKGKYGVHEGLGLYYGPAPMPGRGVFVDPAAEPKFKHYLADSARYIALKGRRMDDLAAVRSKMAAMQRRFREDSLNHTSEQDRAFNVIADLVDDKVVPNPANVKWFGLSSTELIVNGMKQSAELQKKYMLKYGISQNNGLYYGPVQMHGTGVFIDADPSRPPLPPGRLRQPKLREQKSGYMQPQYLDSGSLRRLQLIRRQQVFAADRNIKPDLLDRQQGKGLKMQRKWLTTDRKLVHDPNMMAAVSGIIGDLVNANVLSHKSDQVYFNLTNSGLMVNGKKQPEELHQKLKAKYLHNPGYQPSADLESNQNFGIHYNSRTDSMGLGVTDGPDTP
jgi:beta-lactamase regulating signal transducer with metallopeptidase domain